MTDSPSSDELRRSISGDLVRKVTKYSPSARLEVFSRHEHGNKTMWEFKQPALALFWFSSGFKHARLLIDRNDVDVPISPLSNLGLVAAHSSIEGELETDEYFGYSVVFLDVARLSISRLKLKNSIMTFGNDKLQASFADLSQGASRDDPFFDLMLEGWALQALARVGGFREPSVTGSRGLPRSANRLVTAYIEENFDRRVSVSELAAVAGYSERHFSRAFRETHRITPMQYVNQYRIEMAKRMINAGRQSMTDVAFSCGFSQVQHFSVMFRKATGMSPTAYSRELVD